MSRGATILAALLGGCSYDSPLHSVTFPLYVGGLQVDPSTMQARQAPLPGQSDQPLTFQAASVGSEIPWTVTLTTAQVALGPIYFFNAAAYTSTEATEGRVVSEVLATFDVDALDPTLVTTTPGGVGDNEPVLSIWVWLTEDQSGPIAQHAGRGVAVMHAVGTAQRTIQQAGQPTIQTVPFDGLFEFPTNATAYRNYFAHHGSQFPVNAANPNVGFTPDNGGTLTLQVDPTHWFDNLDFETLVSSGSAPYGFTNITQQLEATILNPVGFTFTWASQDN